MHNYVYMYIYIINNDDNRAGQIHISISHSKTSCSDKLDVPLAFNGHIENNNNNSNNNNNDNNDSNSNNDNDKLDVIIARDGN